MLKKVMVILMASIMVLTVSGCQKPEGESNSKTEAQSKPVAEKNQLNIAYTADPEGLDPQMTAAVSTYLVTCNMYDTLVTVTPEWEVIPDIAESWEVSPDGMEISFKLKQGIKFHNGREMTATDVKYSFERLKSDKSPKAKDYANIIDIQIVDDYNIKFVTEKLDVDLLSGFAYPWAVIVPEEAAESLKTNPVGTGAYKFVEWVPQQNVTMVRNDDYFGDKAKIENVKYVMMPDSNSQLAGLQMGDLDIIEVTGDQIETLKESADFKVYTEAMNSVQIMALNMDNEILSNLKVRQAIAMSINKDEIIKAAVWGYGDKIGSHLPFGSPDYVDTNNVMAYNPEKAKELLKEAGYENGFTIKLTLPKNYQIHVDTGLIIADQLSKVGITAEVEIIEWGEWVSRVYTGKDYDMTIVGHMGRLNSYDFLSRYYSDSGDYISLKTGEVDELLDTALKETDEAKRKEIYKEIQDTLAENVPAVYIHTPHKMFAMAKNVEDMRNYPIDIYNLKDVYFSN